MNRQARILFNIISSSNGGNSLELQSSFVSHSFDQQHIYSLLAQSICAAEGFQSLGIRLAEIARQAEFFKQTEVVERASDIMLALPISGKLKVVARHYQALCSNRKGHHGKARKLLESVIEESTPQYRARALQVIGRTYYEQGDFEKALPFYIAAGRTAIDCDLPTLAMSQFMIAVVRSIQGDHKQSLDDLEKLFPLAHLVGKQYPAFYYDYLNSLAVELGEVGRMSEAEAACAVTLASPFASAYPNWFETRDELRAKRTAATPSVVAVSAATRPRISPPQPARNVTPVRAVNSDWLACLKICFQRSALPVAISATTTSVLITPTILDRLIHSINPRSPPAPFLN